MRDLSGAQKAQFEEVIGRPVRSLMAVPLPGSACSTWTAQHNNLALCAVNKETQDDFNSADAELVEQCLRYYIF